MPEQPIKGKTAIVTGAAKRIGRAIALALADSGANVVIHYRSSQGEAQELLGEIKAKGVGAWLLPADFEKPEETSSLFERALAAAGPVELLVNSASIFPKESFSELSFESIVTNARVNAWAPYLLGREMRRLVGSGSIVNIIDSRIKGEDWTHTGYILSKHVLDVLTRMMAVEYAPYIRVNGVGPGLILPPPGKPMSYIENLKNTVPLREHGSPEDVADAVIYLLKSTYITGTTIFVDGGRHLKEYIEEGKRE
jgi:NAD(P)-dependent dehydrogenase (short-subunit alcohol dehydrogenase family)